jgi:hypothetical protein
MVSQRRNELMSFGSISKLSLKQIDTVCAKIKALPFNIKPTYYFVVDADGKVRQKTFN